MRLTEFLERMDDTLDDGVSTMDVEISIHEVDGSYQYWVMFHSIDTGKELGKIKI